MYFLTYCLVAGFVGGLLVLAALLRALELSGKLRASPSRCRRRCSSTDRLRRARPACRPAEPTRRSARATDVRDGLA